jgi:hypothetical protein
MARRFIIDVLSKESRVDDFVTATITRVRVKPKPWDSQYQYVTMGYPTPYDYEDEYHLSLNCAMKRAQIRVTFKPKFSNLDQLVLVVSSAPSLEKCYVFETVNYQDLVDFGKFERIGRAGARKWYSLAWSDDPSATAHKIGEQFFDAVRRHLEAAVKRLSERDTQ